MNIMEDFVNKIDPSLFLEDIRDHNFKKKFHKVLAIYLESLIGDYDFDEIDEEPFEVLEKGIMIGFGAKTIQLPPRIEYIDLNIKGNPETIQYIKEENLSVIDFNSQENITRNLQSFSKLRLYYCLDNLKKIDQITFVNLGLKYVFMLDCDCKLSRVRIVRDENNTDINMRTVYEFEMFEI